MPQAKIEYKRAKIRASQPVTNGIKLGNNTRPPSTTCRVSTCQTQDARVPDIHGKRVLKEIKASQPMTNGNKLGNGTHPPSTKYPVSTRCQSVKHAWDTCPANQ
jgi:hypothetical protein